MRKKDTACQLLASAEALDWPAGVTANNIFNEPGEGLEIVVAGVGGEAVWHEWVAANNDGDMATEVWSTLDWAAETIAIGDDPGPTKTWNRKCSRWVEELEEHWRTHRNAARTCSLNRSTRRA
jgi:hypothetical protein